MKLLVKEIQILVPTKDSTPIFWQCFNHNTLKDNKRNQDRKRHVLLIIADDFTYKELQVNLGLQQFELFFSTKEHVNMSSYKTDVTSELPVLYLQDYKKAL
ncbi:hypothetical protein GLOIN_2v1483553 [Rhizophagus clarus]|uniref:Uncharacterized protein n=1 Tax=Rhizophagus clarus TaxID=94130 RepID=A0A8H3M173_9GLOM|nr:hypothetical protein GLOIN_2v1483553 [Rhizophagus clarus]